ncbi:RidA family protein [Acinetobacter beijerinckii]|uniref:RidA family protein n=1 Tax=Acinetobacter beijerinckii TaxID=262668 RepID=UPI003AF63797
MSHSDIQKINMRGDEASQEVMSAVTVFNQVVYLSGQVPKNPDLDIEGQTLDILATVEQLLASANSDKSRLLSVQLFLKNLSDFPTVNAIYVDWLKDCVAPSRATIQADLVNPNWLIEIAVIAAQK